MVQAEDEVAEFLRGGLAIVQGEPGTITWYATKLGPSTFGIFDTFVDDSGRQAHLSGRSTCWPPRPPAEGAQPRTVGSPGPRGPARLSCRVPAIPGAPRAPG